MVEYMFNLSQTTVPAGCIQFVITNNGTEPHNFDIAGVKILDHARLLEKKKVAETA